MSLFSRRRLFVGRRSPPLSPGPWSGWGRSAARAERAWVAAAAATSTVATGRPRKSWFGHWKIAAGTGTVLGLPEQLEAAGMAPQQNSWHELK